jgi:hypothetical protein
MRNRTKVIMTALTAALTLAVAVSSAGARRVELSNQQIRVVWSTTSKLTFANAEGGLTAACPVTLEGSFHSRTLSKVSGQLIGYITRAALTRASCVFTGGVEDVRILNGVETTTNTLPWHIRYDSFTGPLPRIETVRLQLVGASFVLTAFTVPCLYKSTAARPAFGDTTVNRETGAVTGLRALGEKFIPLFEGGFLCPEEGRFNGLGSVTLLGTTTAISVRLVQ